MRQTHKTAPDYVHVLAREFRRKQTTAEEFMWDCLRDRKLHGFKFRRQHPIGRYVADFFCNEAGIVLELDGKVHEDPGRVAYDKVRDEVMALRGLKVIRIRNEDLERDPADAIVSIIEVLMSSPPRLPGEGAGG